MPAFGAVDFEVYAQEQGLTHHMNRFVSFPELFLNPTRWHRPTSRDATFQARLLPRYAGSRSSAWKICAHTSWSAGNRKPSSNKCVNFLPDFCAFDKSFGRKARQVVVEHCRMVRIDKRMSRLAILSADLQVYPMPVVLRRQDQLTSFLQGNLECNHPISASPVRVFRLPGQGSAFAVYLHPLPHFMIGPISCPSC
jgi:hypothetical protein